MNLKLPPAWRYPRYRTFWVGSLASVSGFQILRLGQFWLIFQLTNSTLALGYVGLANGIPAIILNLAGGLAADKVDQRRLIVIAQSITASLIFLLATLTLLGSVQVWHILSIAFLARGRRLHHLGLASTLLPALDRLFRVPLRQVLLGSLSCPGGLFLQASLGLP